MNEELRARLFARTQLDATGCWLWTGAASGRGHGLIWWKGKLCSVARLALAQLEGRAIEYGQFVRRTCGQPSCWRPEHLALDTTSNRGRRRRASSRLGPGADDYFRRQHKVGMSICMLARYHDLTEAQVDAAIQRARRRAIADEIEHLRENTPQGFAA